MHDGTNAKKRVVQRRRGVSEECDIPLAACPGYGRRGADGDVWPIHVTRIPARGRQCAIVGGRTAHAGSCPDEPVCRQRACRPDGGQCPTAGVRRGRSADCHCAGRARRPPQRSPPRVARAWAPMSRPKTSCSLRHASACRAGEQEGLSALDVPAGRQSAAWPVPPWMSAPVSCTAPFETSTGLADQLAQCRDWQRIWRSTESYSAFDVCDLWGQGRNSERSGLWQKDSRSFDARPGG
jgi:hypothetical protein